MTLDDLRTLEKKATPGEWGNVHHVLLATVGDDFPAVASCVQCIDDQADNDNAEFIAALRSQPAGTPAWAVKGPDGEMRSVHLSKNAAINAVPRTGYIYEEVLIVEKP